jgi:hypothetical protein
MKTTQRGLVASLLLALCLTAPCVFASRPLATSLLFHAHGVERSHPNGDDVAFIDADLVVVPASASAAGRQRTVDAVDTGTTAATACADPPSPPPREPESPWPPTGRDLVALAVIVFALSLVGGAGIGGGAILVPALILIERFSTGTAVALSNITILGGALANFLCNAPRRRAGGAEPLIDWCVAYGGVCVRVCVLWGLVVEQSGTRSDPCSPSKPFLPTQNKKTPHKNNTGASSRKWSRRRSSAPCWAATSTGCCQTPSPSPS